MATANPISEGNSTSGATVHAEAAITAGMEAARPDAGAQVKLLVQLSSLQPEQLEGVLEKLGALGATLPAEELLVATHELPAVEVPGTLRMVSSTAGATGGGVTGTASWTLTAADFVSAHQLAQKHEARAILMLGPECDSLSAAGLAELALAAVAGAADLVVPEYDLPANAGLVNSAILYPLTRALFAQRARFPLAVDLGLSPRMAERLATAGQRYVSLNQPNALMWPVDEAAVAGFTVQECGVGARIMPTPIEADLNSILALVAGSLFADVDTKAAYWQRARVLPLARRAELRTEGEVPEIGPMLDSFRLAYTNLREIWSLVLPPNSLLGLKRLSTMEAGSFRMPESLWARIIYDFLLAYRLRTINRGHLLGALTPLYLAWAAGHINVIASGTTAEEHIEAVAAAFEADKPYLVSRWRWPDRFNP